jgi:hypothetical protein
VEVRSLISPAHLEASVPHRDLHRGGGSGPTLWCGVVWCLVVQVLTDNAAGLSVFRMSLEEGGDMGQLAFRRFSSGPVPKVSIHGR